MGKLYLKSPFDNFFFKYEKYPEGFTTVYIGTFIDSATAKDSLIVTLVDRDLEWGKALQPNIVYPFNTSDDLGDITELSEPITQFWLVRQGAINIDSDLEDKKYFKEVFTTVRPLLSQAKPGQYRINPRGEVVIRNLTIRQYKSLWNMSTQTMVGRDEFAALVSEWDASIDKTAELRPGEIIGEYREVVLRLIRHQAMLNMVGFQRPIQITIPFIYTGFVTGMPVVFTQNNDLFFGTTGEPSIVAQHDNRGQTTVAIEDIMSVRDAVRVTAVRTKEVFKEEDRSKNLVTTLGLDIGNPLRVRSEVRYNWTKSCYVDLEKLFKRFLRKRLTTDSLEPLNIPVHVKLSALSKDSLKDTDMLHVEEASDRTKAYGRAIARLNFIGTIVKSGNEGLRQRGLEYLNDIMDEVVFTEALHNEELVRIYTQFNEMTEVEASTLPDLNEAGVTSWMYEVIPKFTRLEPAGRDSFDFPTQMFGRDTAETFFQSDKTEVPDRVLPLNMEQVRKGGIEGARHLLEFIRSIQQNVTPYRVRVNKLIEENIDNRRKL